MPDRRAFLTFLAGSPLLAAFPQLSAFAQATAGGLEQAAHALDVFDFEAAAQKLVPPAHWGYLASGVDGEATLRANREGFDRYQLKARRFVDVSRIDLSLTLFGQTYSSPIALCPIGSAGAFHPDGEKAAAAAARTRNQMLMLSTQATFSVEDVSKARGGPIWFQLYTTNNLDVTRLASRRRRSRGTSSNASRT